MLIGHAGLGDKIDHYLYYMTVAKLVKGTLVISWSNSTQHGPYDPKIFDFLGIDTSLTGSWLSSHYPNLSSETFSFPEIHLDTKPMACNTVIFSSIYSCPAVYLKERVPDRHVHHYCPLTYTTECVQHVCNFYDFYTPNLQEIRKSNIRDKCMAAGLSHKKRNENAIIVVVHVRQGDICLHCNDQEYYKRLHRSIYMVAQGWGKNIQYVVEAEKDIRFVPRLPIAYLGIGRDVLVAMCSFVTGDILVTAGSSFTDVALFAQPNKPIVFEEPNKDWVKSGKVLAIRKYIWPKNESIQNN